VGNWPDDAPHVAIVVTRFSPARWGAATSHGSWRGKKVRDQILTLPPETLICPGHGPLTTVAEEKEHNPFF